MLNSGRAPYDVGRDIWSIAFTNADQADALWALWLQWGGLTDWVERRPDERDEAERSMLEAAQAWLDVEHDDTRRIEYFDHWLYEVIGYERPATRGT